MPKLPGMEDALYSYPTAGQETFFVLPIGQGEWEQPEAKGSETRWQPPSIKKSGWEIESRAGLVITITGEGPVLPSL